MTIYVVTTSNCNDPAFCAGINESASGHTIDFSALPSTFDGSFDADLGLVTVGDATSSFEIGEGNFAGALDATLGSPSLWNFFDSFKGSGGADSLDGGAGADQIEAGDGDDAVFGGVGDDLIQGGSGSDTLFGGEGADTLHGGSGDDTISMGRTQDLSATDGDGDTLVLNDGFGNDIIENFESPTDQGGGAVSGNDQVDVTGLTDVGGNPVTTEDVFLTDTNGDGTGDAILIFPNSESIRLSGVNPSEVTAEAQLVARHSIARAA